MASDIRRPNYPTLCESLRDDLIVLRRFTEADIPVLVEELQDPDIPRFTRVPSPYSEADARAFLAGDVDTTFAITENDRVVGGVGLLRPDDGRIEVGYWVARSARGRGIATHAVRLVSRWALESLGYARVELHADVEHLVPPRGRQGRLQLRGRCARMPCSAASAAT